MARKLPWAASTSSAPNATTNDSAETYSPARKRRKISPAPSATVAADTDITSPEGRNGQDRKRRVHDTDRDPSRTQDGDQARGREQNRNRARGRDQSTSPPPAPPDVRFMYEGIDADDGYMMVEDEFNEIAKTFTAHLHHAEYKRLMQEARERKQLNIDTDPEMVNGHRSTADPLRRKVGKILGLENGRENKNGLGDEDVEKDESGDEITREERRVGDPWAGTTLAGLMRYEPERDKLNLRASAGVKSASRAALGFRSNATGTTSANTGASVSVNGTTDHATDDEEPSRNRRDIASLPRNIGMKGHTERQQSVKPSNDSIPLSTKRQTPVPTSDPHHHSQAARSSAHIKTEKADRPIKVENGTIPTVIKSEYPATKRRPIRKFIDDLDDFDEVLFEEPRIKTESGTQKIATFTSKHNTDTKSISKLTRPRSKGIKKEEDDGKDDSGGSAARKRMLDRLDEVPVFLV